MAHAFEEPGIGCQATYVHAGAAFQPVGTSVMAGPGIMEGQLDGGAVNADFNGGSLHAQIPTGQVAVPIVRRSYLVRSDQRRFVRLVVRPPDSDDSKRPCDPFPPSFLPPPFP